MPVPNVGGGGGVVGYGELLPFYANPAPRGTFTILCRKPVTFTLPPPYAKKVSAPSALSTAHLRRDGLRKPGNLDTAFGTGCRASRPAPSTTRGRWTAGKGLYTHSAVARISRTQMPELASRRYASPGETTTEPLVDVPSDPAERLTTALGRSSYW